NVGEIQHITRWRGKRKQHGRSRRGLEWIIKLRRYVHALNWQRHPKFRPRCR
ncbi:hypothetical protein L9F63_009285, partial [Diploptera punctata]